MLYPQASSFRQVVDLSGFWQFCFDPDNTGESRDWPSGFEDYTHIAVPASWNEQFAESRDYLGTGWYQTRFDLPWNWQDQRIHVRFNGVNYLAEVWLNGAFLGEHEGGYLPFDFDITDRVQEADNLLVVRVNGELASDRVPPGNLGGIPGATFGHVQFPDPNYDFYPFCGIQRPVLLYTTPQQEITDLTVITGIDGANGSVRVEVASTASEPLTIRAIIKGHGADITTEQDIAQKGAVVNVSVPDAAFWSPEAPNLYHLTVELLRDGRSIDRYTLKIGIRTITVSGDQLLLNGQPIKLLGFGRHEDFPIVGKGMLPALIIKDYSLMQWIGANSFRTTHYPYSEQMMQLADELGFMVIDETPAVGLFFSADAGLEKRNQLCLQMLREMIQRDKNHPSVIMWSLANEPHSVTPEARQHYFANEFDILDNPSYPEAVAAFQEQTNLVRSLDSTRPVTLVSHNGVLEDSFDFLDVVSVNRYNGWYTESGQIDVGIEVLSKEIDLIQRRFPKPIILSEFGADTIPGHHALPPEMFSEEFQVEFLTKYIEMLDSKSSVVGQHIWNLCDFKVIQSTHRVNGYNYKGVFTRDRRPKLAAHRVKELWTKAKEDK